MASEHRRPTEESGTGADKETRRPRTNPDLAADVAAAEMSITAEAEVGMGEIVQPQPPPPHQDGQKSRGSGQNGREGRRSE